MQISNTKITANSPDFRARKLGRVITHNTKDVTEIYSLNKSDISFAKRCLNVIGGYRHLLPEDKTGIYNGTILDAMRKYFKEFLKNNDDTYDKYFITIKNNSRITGFARQWQDSIDCFLTTQNDEAAKRGLMYGILNQAGKFEPDLSVILEKDNKFLRKIGFKKEKGRNEFYVDNSLETAKQLRFNKDFPIVHSKTAQNFDLPKVLELD